MSERAGKPAAGASGLSAFRGRELDRLFPLVYEELRGVAHRRLRAEAKGHTLSTTALVHETYLRLANEREGSFENREQFFALAARAMRRILVDYARRHRAHKRSAAGERISLSALDASTDLANSSASDIADRAELVLMLDDALERLAEIDERLSRVVEYRFFVGLSERECAELLGVTARTITRDWVRARGWLMQQLGGADPPVA